MKSVLGVIWNIIAGAAVLSGLYQGYAVYKTPKAEVTLAYRVAMFSFPPSLMPVFDDSSDKKLLEASYADVVKYSAINSVAYAGLHNNGSKSATDVRVTFPTASLITVEPERSKAYEIRDNSNVIIEKLAPGESVYIKAWMSDSVETALDKVSSVHSEGDVVLLPRVEVQRSTLNENENAFFGMSGIAIFFVLATGFFGYKFFWRDEDSAGNAPAIKSASNS
jgi:hypothetical protein